MVNVNFRLTCVIVAVVLLVDVSLVDGESQRGRELVQHILVGQPEAGHDISSGNVLSDDHARV